MENFIKIPAFILITLIIGMFTKKQNPEISVVLIITAVCVIFTFSINAYIRPIITFISNLQELAQLDQGAIKTLLKVAGIGLISEITALLCSDAGFATLGKLLQSSCVFAIILISIPIFNELISLITKVLMP